MPTDGNGNSLLNVAGTTTVRSPGIWLVWSQGIGVYDRSVNPMGLQPELLNSGPGWNGAGGVVDKMIAALELVAPVIKARGLSCRGVVFRNPWGHVPGVQRIDTRQMCEARGLVKAADLVAMRLCVQRVKAWLVGGFGGGVNMPQVACYIGLETDRVARADWKRSAENSIAGISQAGFDAVVVDQAGTDPRGAEVCAMITDRFMQADGEPMPFNPAMTGFGSWCLPSEWAKARTIGLLEKHAAAVEQWDMRRPQAALARRVVMPPSGPGAKEQEALDTQAAVDGGCSVAIGMSLWNGAGDEAARTLRVLGLGVGQIANGQMANGKSEKAASERAASTPERGGGA